MTPDIYQQMSVVHKEGDQEITWRELGETQREIRAHSRALAQILRVGKERGKRNSARFYDNISSWACDAPILRCVAKTHKEVAAMGYLRQGQYVGQPKV